MKAEVISIGNELLNGKTINTNANFLCSKLLELGIPTHRIITVGDDAKLINEALEESLTRAEVILLTGGLGPTHDDITKKVLVDFFNTELIFNQEIFNDVKTRFERRGLTLPEVNRVMAYIPKAAELLPNPIGTARGMLFTRDNKMIIVLPGVPREMQSITENSVIPILKKKYPENRIQVNLFRTTGIPESSILELIKADLKKYYSYEIAFLPKYSGVDIRVTLKNGDIDDPLKFSSFKNLLERKIADFIYTTENKELEEIVGEILRKVNWTISVAESMTGGLIQDKLTDISGSSDYYMGGVVTYSNQSKIRILKVKEESLKKNGAVSENVAGEMAVGVREKFGTDLGISSTGIAGPGGASPNKPIGLVYLGLASSDEVVVRKHYLGSDRFLNKQRAAQAALELVRRKIMGIQI